MAEDAEACQYRREISALGSEQIRGLSRGEHAVTVYAGGIFADSVRGIASVTAGEAMKLSGKYRS
ncbi:hypothetical protein C7212DRAFT_190200 [Tuber magnatum]|uniref:Rhamnogalacturonan lyase domain-containing protein n=1 Tax=Tuber magnatum TaxID=42249 RepID=A0A317SR24_9PEZI|nr:hypothetical protein C7212DRAFT_190200 [Tuber magnatum]